MCVVGATTATRATRPSTSIRCATCRPNVVLPAAGVADARNESPSWAATASVAACCQARSGRLDGHAGSERRRLCGAGWVTADVKGAAGYETRPTERRWARAARRTSTLRLVAPGGIANVNCGIWGEGRIAAA